MELDIICVHWPTEHCTDKHVLFISTDKVPFECVHFISIHLVGLLQISIGVWDIFFVMMLS